MAKYAEEGRGKRGGNPNDGENTHPYPPDINFGKLRTPVESHEHVAAHDAALARLDRGESSEKGGR